MQRFQVLLKVVRAFEKSEVLRGYSQNLLYI
jgi:hypothetical protein